MVAKELGTKLTCQSCETKFYDLNKKNPICPKCGAEYIVAKTRGRKTIKSEKVVEVTDIKDSKITEITETISESTVDDEKSSLSEDNLENIDIPEVEDVEEDNNTLIEDTSDIGDDDNDIAGVIVNNDNSTENI